MELIQQVRPRGSPRSETIIKAAYRMARVMVRLFCRYLQGAILVDMLKRAVLEYAMEQAAREGDKKPTLTELSLISGLDTRAIKTLLSDKIEISEHDICAEAAILACWAREPTLRNRYTGKPADLPIFGYDGSFQSLVRRIAGRGVSIPTAVKRLEATGNIKVVDKHFVRLIEPSWRFIEDNEDELLDYGSQAIASLAAAIENNLEYRHAPEKKWVERRLYSIRVDAAMVGELSCAINNLLLTQKKELALLIRQYERVETTGDTDVIIGAGYYSWKAGMAKSSELDDFL